MNQVYENVANVENVGSYLWLEFYRNGNPRDNYYIEPQSNVFIVKRLSNSDNRYYYDVYKDNKLHCAAMGKTLIKQHFNINIS